MTDTPSGKCGGGARDGACTPDTTSRDGDTGIEELLARAMAGDREAMALFIFSYGERIRRRLRGKLSPVARSVFDSQDLLGVVVAKVDEYLASGAFWAECEEQIWSLIWTIGERTVWRQNKLAARSSAGLVQRADGAASQNSMTAIERAEEVKRVLTAAPGDRDREALRLRLVGFSLTEMAHIVGVSPRAMWKRWERPREPARAAGGTAPDLIRIQGDSGLGTRDSGLGTRDSGLGTRDSGLGAYDTELTDAA